MGISLSPTLSTLPPASIAGVHKGIYEALVAAGVAGGRIYDEVPDDVAFPHVEIGELDAAAQDCDGFDGVEERRTIQVWSRQGGQSEAKGLLDAIRAALHDTRLSGLQEQPLVWCTTAATEKQPDGRTTLGRLELKIIWSVPE